MAPLHRLAPLLVLIALPAAWLLTPAADWLNHTAEVARAGHAAAVPLFLVLYVLSGVLLVPASWGMAWAGFVYGPLAGPLLSWLATQLSFVVNLTLARTVLRAQVRRRWHGRGWELLDRALLTRGWVLVAWLRASPLSPFHPLSFGLGTTHVSARDAVTGTAIGNLPSVLTWTWLGASLPELHRAFEQGLGAIGPAWWLSLALTVSSAVVLTRLARAELRRFELEP